jgi:hypothetical protein
VAGQDHRSAGQQSAPLGRGDHVRGKGRLVVPTGRRVGQAVPAQVHRDDAAARGEPAGDRRPHPGSLGDAVDQEHAGRVRRSTPVQEMDPVRRLDQHDEAVRLGRGVGRRNISVLERERAVHPGLG